MPFEVIVDRSRVGTQQPGSDSFVSPVAVAGMHRSGTSMLANLLQHAGLHLGEDADLMPPAEENPEGFYEHLGFVRLNNEVLNAAGAGWDCPPPAGFDWGAKSLDPFRERARLLAEPLRVHVQSQGQGQGRATRPWGWKDPRNSLTLPFWRSALGPLRTVVLVRNPLEVVTSLHRRNGFSIALGLTLWQIYAERFLEDTEPDQRLVTHYDAYFAEPDREIARVLEFIGMENDRDLSALRAAAVPALRHHRKSLRDLEESGFPAAVIDLYRRLCREAGWWEGDVGPDFVSTATIAVSGTKSPSIARGIGGVDLVRVENEALRRNNADFITALAGRETRIAELESALAAHEAARDELEGRVAERDGRLDERHNVLARKDHAIAMLQRQLADQAAELDPLHAQVAELTDHLAESERGRAISEIHERELRSMLTDVQAIQFQRDAEIMGTLGAVLSRYAPGAPASIYHRRLVEQLRRMVEEHVPPGSRTLVATYGDNAMLLLGDRPTEPFPQSAQGIVADYTDISGTEAVTQLEALRDDGAEFLVVPSPALPWLTHHPELAGHIQQRYTEVARERGVSTIFALGPRQGQIPA